MERRSGPPTKTFRFRLHYRPQAEAWFAGTARLFNQVAAFYFAVIQAHPGVLELSAQEALTALERLTHATRRNPAPLLPLTAIVTDCPAMLRRAAIHAAWGAAQSFQSHLARWRHRKEQAEEKARQKGQRCSFHERPPVPPRQWHRAVVLYQGMYRTLDDDAVLLRVWTGQAWIWARFGLSGRALPADWQAGSPQVVRRKKGWALHIPATKKDFAYPAKVEKQLQEPHTRLCAVDLNINDALAVCTIQETDGTVVATRFIRGGRELQGRRKRALGRVAVKRAQTGILAEGQPDNIALFRQIRAWDEDTAHRVSRRIVAFAQAHGATIIVFEHLGHFRPQKGRYSKRGNEKRAYWLRGRILHYTRYKAWAEGIITCRVNPKNTSQQCACCGGAVARYGQGEQPIGYRPGAPLVSCPDCGMRGHADRNAGLNIGRRLLTRYGNLAQEKPPTGQPSWARRSPKGEGVLVSQEAQNRDRPHAKPERHGARDGHGTARRGSRGAARGSDGIPRPLRPQGSGSSAAGPLGVAYAGVPEEAAGF